MDRLAHARSAALVLDEQGVDPERGLDQQQVRERLVQFGKNRLPEPPRDSAWARLLRQFINPLVLTLLVSALVAVWVGASQSASVSFIARYGNALAIALIVLLNALMGFVQEGRAAAALDALEKLVSTHARIRRDGVVAIIDADELVPGDILELEAGDAVPADSRLIRASDFEVEESALTGESVPVAKAPAANLAADAPLADRSTMVYVGTTITRGTASAVVVATGSATELGRIGGLLSLIEKQPTPLEQRLQAFGKRILYICLAVSVALFVLGIMRGHQTWPELLLQCVSLAVAIIPEGLPAITTITLGLGMQRMAERGAVVRRLPAVETLGTATVICTDKTGTLTENQMTVRKMWCGGVSFSVTGEGYEPRGAIAPEQDFDAARSEVLLRPLLLGAVLCNTATLRQSDDSSEWITIGDPTEAALLTLAHKGGVVPEPVRKEFTLVRQIPFAADRKRMTVIVHDARGVETAHVKGSVDVLLPLCSSQWLGDSTQMLGEEERRAVLAAAESMSKGSLRVLAIAERRQPDPSDPERDLVLVGLVGMMDPPRAGIADAVAACRKAGVRTVMITGDHPATAMAIARELGILQPGTTLMTGAELGALGPEEIERRIGGVAVFARTTPEQKLTIVRALKTRREVVAMTGDGVNDAPALREAHIGVAMGRSGTDVARQAADLVLTDDNFATLVEAIRQGRAIYRNIQKFIFFLLSSNAGLALTVFAVSMNSSWFTLTPLMILWINLVTNGLPALALGVDPPDARQMFEAPRKVDEPLLDLSDYAGIAFVGGVMALMAIAMYAVPPAGHDEHAEGLRAFAFSVLALAPLWHAWSCRSPVASIFRRGVPIRVLAAACAVSACIHLSAILVPPLRPVFHTFPLSWLDAAHLLGLSVAVVPAVELAKAVRRALVTSKPARATTALE